MDISVLPKLSNYPDGFWLYVILGLTTLGVTIELWKYIKDRYWFGTWNWERQKACRQALQVYNAMNWYIGTFSGLSNFSFPMSEKIMMLESMKKWGELTSCKHLTEEEYDEKYQETVEWFNESGVLTHANSMYVGYGKDNIKPISKAYGYRI